MKKVYSTAVKSCSKNIGEKGIKAITLAVFIILNGFVLTGPELSNIRYNSTDDQ